MSQEQTSPRNLFYFVTLVICIGLCGWAIYKRNEVEPHCILTIKDTFAELPGNMNYDFHFKGEMGDYRADLIKRISSSGIESILRTEEVYGHRNGPSAGGPGYVGSHFQMLEVENFFQEPGTHKEETFRITEFREIKLFRYRHPKDGWIEYILRVQPK